MRASKSGIMQSLNEQVTTRTREHAQALQECKRETEKAKQEIEALTIQKDNAKTPADFRSAAAAIKEKEQYITFLEGRSRTIQAEPALNREEYDQISNALAEENARELEQAAPEIYKKYNELVQLLDNYTATANGLQEVLNAAQRAHFKRTLGGHLWHELRENRANDKKFEAVLLAYLNTRAKELNGRA